MMKDIKNCFKMLKYGYQLKTNIVCAILFMMIGCFFWLIAYEQLVLVAAYFSISILFMTQTMHMLLLSGNVAASPARKRIEFRYLDILNVFGGIMIVAVLVPVAFLGKPEDYEGVSSESLLILCGLMVIVLYIYMGIAFKTMILGIVVFMPTLFILLGLPMSNVDEWLTKIFLGKTALVIVIFVLEVALGIVLGHGCRKLFYRKEMSKLAKGAKLRMEQS